jgi:hypothetical protein
MSDNDRDYPLIRNEETLRRRAWIDRALAGVRGRLKPAELGEAPVPSEASTAEPAEPTGEGSRPKLYLVRNSETR